MMEYRCKHCDKLLAMCDNGYTLVIKHGKLSISTKINDTNITCPKCGTDNKIQAIANR